MFNWRLRSKKYWTFESPSAKFLLMALLSQLSGRSSLQNTLVQILRAESFLSLSRCLHRMLAKLSYILKVDVATFDSVIGT